MTERTDCRALHDGLPKRCSGCYEFATVKRTERNRWNSAGLPLLFTCFLLSTGVRVATAQCYTFSTSNATLTVNITRLPPPMVSAGGIYQYNTNSGLLANVSLTVGGTTYVPSGPVDMDVTVSSDASLNFSQFSLNVSFNTSNNVTVGALPSLAWNSTYFQGGALPPALPSLSTASTLFTPTIIVSVQFVDNTYQLTTIGTCSTVYPPLSVSGPQSLPGGTVGSAYADTTVTATGGNGNYAWSAPGLPSGLSISSSGIISGTPTFAFNGNVTVMVSDNESPPMTTSKTYSLTIAYPPLMITSPQSLPGGTVNTGYTHTTVIATGGNGNYAWSAPGLPAGLSISSAGVISGTPTVAFNGNVTVTVSDSESPSATASTPYSLTIYPALMITGPASLAEGTDSAAYSNTTMTATGGSGTGTYTWSAPGLPGGLSISSSGIISGTPTVAFNGNVTITVSDSESPPSTATKPYSLIINPELAITGPASLAGATVNIAYPNTTITASGGTAPLTWSATGLPAGLRIASATGIITGVPPTNLGGPFTAQVTVQDINLATATKMYGPISVANGPPSVCDLNHVGSTTVVDIQTIIDEALGIAPPVDNLNGAGAVNVVDVQIVTDAVVGMGCLTTNKSPTISGQPALQSPSLAAQAVSPAMKDSRTLETVPATGANADVFMPAELTDLGTLGGSYAVASGINNFGQVVGSSATGESSVTHAFIWAAGQMIDLGLPVGATAVDSAAFGLNGAGQAVGTYSSGGDASNGFLFDSGITIALTNVTYGSPRAINYVGQVVGDWSTESAASPAHAFLWNGGTATDLGTLGGSGSEANCINDGGQIAGSSQLADDSAVHAFRYDGAVLTDLGTLGGTNSAATGINNAGQIVGYSETTGNESRHAFLYSGGLMVDLGALGGADSRGDSINSAGQIAGWAQTANGEQHAFLWSAGRMIDLNSLATVGPGVALVEAAAINDVGQIVANGSNGRAYLINLSAQLRQEAIR